MRAAVVHTYGGPEVVRVEHVPDPRARRGEVVVDVRAASVNFPDLLVIRNEYQVSLPTPFVPGSEFAGVISEVGPEVDGWREGDRVSGTSICGAFAERVVVPAASLLRLPEGVNFLVGAAFWVTYSTSYHALRTVARVGPGEWVGILGASGGVGLAAVDVSQVLGARVLAAASTDEKLDLCRARGADATINYVREDLKLRLRELTGGGADVVLDPVGGPSAEQALRSIRWGGRFVTIGFASGEIPRIPLNLVLLKGIVVCGFEMRTFAEHAPAEQRRDRAELLALLADGRLSPHVSAVAPLDEISDTLSQVNGRSVMGKVVLEL